MSDSDAQFCEQFVTDLLGLDDVGRLRRIHALYETIIDESRPVRLIIVGLILRDRGVFEWAEYVFQLARRNPETRLGAVFELATVHGLTGRPDEAVRLLDQLEAEAPLSAYQTMYHAHQLGRVGQTERASRKLDAAYNMEPGWESELVALRQWIEFVRRFPGDEMLSRCDALLATYRFLGPDEVLREIQSALLERRPYSLIRLNDGEGSIVRFSIDDEAQYRDIYTRNRREFHRWWFGHEGQIFTPEFETAVRDFNAVIPRADCLAAHAHTHILVAHRRGCLRNVPAFTNVIRKLEEIRDRLPEQAARITMADPYIHQFMLFGGQLERLLEEQTRIGLVSCHAALPESLKRKFGYSDVRFHKTPGESTITKGVEPEPFAVWHTRLQSELADAEPGLLYLVAAGVMSKIYCDVIKRAGGVAIDVGSVVDIWMKAPTRVFSDEASGHTLEAA